MHSTTMRACHEMRISKLDPTHDRVIVLRDKMDSKSAGGIELVHSFEKSNWCTVVAVPTTVNVGKKQVKPNLEPGDRVFIRPQDSKPLDGGTFLKGLGMESESSGIAASPYEWCPYYCIELKELEDGTYQSMDEKVLVQMPRKEKISLGGIILIEAQDLLTRWIDDEGEGTIVSSGAKDQDIKVGDYVSYQRGEGAFVDQLSLITIDAANVFGVLENVGV